MVTRLTKRCRELDKGGVINEGSGREAGGEEFLGVPAGLGSSLKYCTKKNGLGKAAAEVNGRFVGLLFLRDVLEHRRTCLHRASRKCLSRGWRGYVRYVGSEGVPRY